MKEDLSKLKQEILLELSKVKDGKMLADLEIKYSGRKGEFTKILRSLKDLGAEQKKKFGALANEVKVELEQKFVEIKNQFESNKQRQGFVDVTAPGEKIKRGSLHPLTITQNELEDLFTSLGFMVLDGPELESDYYNFEALNIPRTHPARDMQDTFYIDSKNKSGEYDMVMRTQTSPVQVRAMQLYGAPLKCVVPGRVYRNEATDACHDSTFDQIEGLMVGEGISIVNLLAVLKEMLSGIMKTEVKMKVRPGYFPFVEPGIEVDMGCTICHSKGCPSCKHTGWLEMIGAGMVHPKVLEAGGLDPKKYTGFAFGMGTTRLVMMRYNIEDIRLFNGGDLRFLKQF